MRNICLLLTVLAAMLHANAAFAGWEVINLHPEGATASSASGISGGRAVGYVTLGGSTHAALWNGRSPTDYVDLNPVGCAKSEANGISGNEQVGVAPTGNAALWHGSSASYSDLGPGTAYGCDDGWQVGVEANQAALWRGTAESQTNLHPTGSSSSTAYAIADGQQAGEAVTAQGIRHAALWEGNASSFVDLNPGGEWVSSGAHAVENGYQGGYVSLSPQIVYTYAALWNGTAGSFVNLSPEGCHLSWILDMSGRYQVGQANWRPCIWQGTATSFQYLDTFLPEGYESASPTEVEDTGTDIWVAGVARHNGHSEAIVWHYSVPEPASIFGLLVGPAGLLLLARRRK